MKKTIAAVLLAVAGVVHAAPIAMVVEVEGLAIRLFNTPCVSPAVLAQLKPEVREKFRAGNESDHGRPVELCWIQADETTVYIVDADGDSGALPIAIFKPADVL